ncbi:MAG TPA: hypothetical protein VGO47_11805, partial [Chlamydiales bacterium]|nr:hypothetical protein [Chlamydiales bacterium]
NNNVPSDPDDEVNLGLCGNVEVTSKTGNALQMNLLALLLLVLLNVRFGALENKPALDFVGLYKINNSVVSPTSNASPKQKKEKDKFSPERWLT